MRQFQDAVVSLVRSIYPGCLLSRRNWLPSRQCVATGWVLHVSLCPGQEKVLLLRLLRCSGQVSINTSSLASKHRRRGQSGLAVSPYIPHSQQVTSSLRIASSLIHFIQTLSESLATLLKIPHIRSDFVDGAPVTSFAKASCFSLPVCLWRAVTQNS